jgi:hypothetical protein
MRVAHWPESGSSARPLRQEKTPQRSPISKDAPRYPSRSDGTYDVGRCDRMESVDPVARIRVMIPTVLEIASGS